MYKRVNGLLGTEFKSDLEINWRVLCINENLSEDFIREFQEYVSWGDISAYQILSEDFIKEFEDKVNWRLISTRQVLSEDFIRRFKDRVNWYYISNYQLLSWNFILEFKDYVDWDNISSFQPYINDPDYKNLNKEYLNENKYYSLYKKTKDNSWFIGYVIFYRNIFIFNTVADSSYFNKKAKIYWEDLIAIGKTNKIKLIRDVKQI